MTRIINIALLALLVAAPFAADVGYSKWVKMEQERNQ